MSTPMKAKLIISQVEKFEGGFENLIFRAVCKEDGYPEDGSDENNTYAKFSPSADLKLSITNPDLINIYKPGDTFYVDFTPVEK